MTPKTTLTRAAISDEPKLTDSACSVRGAVAILTISSNGSVADLMNSAARGFRIGRDHFDAVLDQVAPVLDGLGIALADEEDDGRGVGGRVVLERAAPVGRDLLGLGGDLVDVALQRQRHDVGIEPVDHRLRLLARAAMALVDGDVVAGLALPVRSKDLIVVFIQLARRVVADIEQVQIGGARRHHTGEGHRAQEGGIGQKFRSRLHQVLQVKLTGLTLPC